jgi:cell division protein FtsQ
MQNQTPIPFDLRLMHWCTQLCLFAFVLVVLACAALALGRLPVFSIRTVTIQGNLLKTSDAALQHAATSAINGTLFTTDLSAIRATLQETPWVRSALVRRQFPNGLRIELGEHTALALWGDSEDEDDARMLNTHGEIFEANQSDVENEHLVRLNGPDENAKDILNMYQYLARPFATAGLTLVSLNQNGRGTWSAETETGAHLELGAGTPEQVLTRSQAFFQTLPVISARLGQPAQALESADLRHHNAYALRLRGVTTETITATGAVGSGKAP